MSSQQSDRSHNTGQNILLFAIIVVLIYIVLDIFGFVPGINIASRIKRGGSQGRWQRAGKSAFGLLISIAIIMVLTNIPV